MNRTVSLSTITVLASVLLTWNGVAHAGSILEATLAEPNQKTEEVSTEQVRRILLDGTALIVDTRSHTEYAAGHIPGARLLDGPTSAHVAAVEKLVNGDKSKALVLYCNGPYCGASRRLINWWRPDFQMFGDTNSVFLFGVPSADQQKSNWKE